MADKSWFLYLLECANGSYYAGITTNVAARFLAHQQGKGARYTRANPPIRILAQAEYADRSAASKAEWALKQLPREAKPGFFRSAG
ncbi:MAG: GIY-YIG nuclease family protein [Fluviibacter phosphoraccumulans]